MWERGEAGVTVFEARKRRSSREQYSLTLVTRLSLTLIYRCLPVAHKHTNTHARPSPLIHTDAISGGLHAPGCRGQRRDGHEPEQAQGTVPRLFIILPSVTFLLPPSLSLNKRRR